ncbi:hypothetical protein AC579_7148 [Pseudocercospora musae]|uniref:Uncharacterized protein n=1 Tax=Pseudocercospora musae TaxID=113226 RepID=A0A139IN57_9PEZI|nr:hypothetical protein AC579_7148 [Pseudocercospora musae]
MPDLDSFHDDMQARIRAGDIEEVTREVKTKWRGMKTSDPRRAELKDLLAELAETELAWEDYTERMNSYEAMQQAKKNEQKATAAAAALT